MALTETDIAFAKMDLQATTLVQDLMGNGKPADGALDFRRSLRERAITAPLAALGISRDSTPALMELAGQTYENTLYAVMAATTNVPAALAMQWAGNADTLNQELRRQVGEDKADAVSTVMFQTVEGNWPHVMRPLRLNTEILAALTDCDIQNPPMVMPSRFTNSAVENERRFAHSSMTQQSMVAFHHLDKQEYLPYGVLIEQAAQNFIMHSVYEMAADHNRDFAVTSDVMLKLGDAYAETLTLARFLKMHPVEQMTLTDLQISLAEKADASGKLMPMALNGFDGAFFAAAFAERAAAAIDADDTQRAILQKHVNRAFGMKDEGGSAPTPINEAAKTRRDLN